VTLQNLAGTPARDVATTLVVTEQLEADFSSSARNWRNALASWIKGNSIDAVNASFVGPVE
jgi:hypothetical protein